jgi:hypothetical protein
MITKAQRAEQMADILTSLWELRKEHREMALANVEWTINAPVVGFKRQGSAPHSDRDMRAVRELIADAEVQVMYLSCPSAFVERPS